MKNSKNLVVRDPDWFPASFRRLMDNFWNADRFFGDDFGNFMPAVNIKDNDKTYEIEVAAPGMQKEDFDVKVDNGVLRISAEREEKKEEKEENYTRREFSYNTFSRSFVLPENVDADNVAAKYSDGILHLTMKKKKVETPKTKKIEIK